MSDAEPPQLHPHHYNLRPHERLLANRGLMWTVIAVLAPLEFAFVFGLVFGAFSDDWKTGAVLGAFAGLVWLGVFFLEETR